MARQIDAATQQISCCNCEGNEEPIPILPRIPVVKHEMQRPTVTPYQPTHPSLWFSPTGREAGDGFLTGITRVLRGISDLPVDGGCRDLVVVLRSAGARNRVRDRQPP